MKNRKIEKLFLLLAFISLFFSTNIFAQPNQKIVLQLSWLHQFQFAGFYIAKERGYYKAVGLDVEIKEYKDGLNIPTVIQTGQADFALGRSSLLIDKSKGNNIVALGAIFQSSPLILLVTKKSGIQSISDLKNKNIMVTNNTKDSAHILAMLSANGIGINDINIQKHSFNTDDLISGKTDAMASYISNEPSILENKNIEYKVFYPQSYGFDFYDDILFTSSEKLSKNPEMVKKFFEASLKGWKYASENIAKTSDMIYEKYNTQNKKLIDIVQEGEILKPLLYHNLDHTIGCLDNHRLEEILTTYKILGLIDSEVDLDQFIYEHNPHQVYKFEIEKDTMFLLILITFLLMVILVMGSVYTSLRQRWLLTNDDLQQKITKVKNEIEILTNEKLKQQEIILNQSKIAAMGEMIGNIAHQWRQPLSIISTNMGLLRADIELGEKITDEVIIQCTEDVFKQTDYLSQTIDNFREYFKPDKSIKKEYRLQEIFDDLHSLVSSSLENNFIQCVMNISGDATIYMTKTTLIQALMNICNNSKDAFVEKNIQSESRFIFVDITQEESDVVILIKDSAGGIRSDIIDKVFEPYFTTKHQSIGTGIGLYMTNQIITKHLYGSIKAENVTYTYNKNEYSGAQFKIIIPLNKNKILDD